MARYVFLAFALIACRSICQAKFTPHQMCEGMLWKKSNTRKCGDGSTLSSPGDCCHDAGGEIEIPVGCRGASISGSKCTYSKCDQAYEIKLQMTTAERWTAAHNVFRCMHGRNNLNWNAGTATYAQSWADNGAKYSGKETKCIMKHSRLTYDADNKLWQPNPRTDGGAGENLGTETGRQSPENSVQRWYAEINDYKGAGQPVDKKKPVGHYTAMIWKDTGDLGCGTCRGSIYNFKGKVGTSNVCQYANEPAGLTIQGKAGKSEADQVPQNNEPTESEDVCCRKIYSEFGPVAAKDSSPSGKAHIPNQSLLKEEPLPKHSKHLRKHRKKTNGVAAKVLQSNTPGDNDEGETEWRACFHATPKGNKCVLKKPDCTHCKTVSLIAKRSTVPDIPCQFVGDITLPLSACNANKEYTFKNTL